MSMATDSQDLAAMRSVNFDWAVQLDDVWRDPPGDVPELHLSTRQRFAEQLQSMRRSADTQGAQLAADTSPLGWIMIGSGGVGKTHLLGAMRRQSSELRAGFVLVDMTDVSNFWQTVLQGYLDSLQTPYVGDQYQYQVLLQQLFTRLADRDKASKYLQFLAGKKTEQLSEDVKKVLHSLGRIDRRRAAQFSDVIRALICLNSEDFDIYQQGYQYLQGSPLDESTRAALGFANAQKMPREIVRGLSWFMSLSGPTVVAFDQLDPLVQQMSHRVSDPAWERSEECGKARSIIEEIGGGLGTMRDTTFRTLPIVTCVESTYDKLQSLVLNTYLHRFEEPLQLQRPSSGDPFRSMIERRLAVAYQAHDFVPPYPSWPFAAEAFQALGNTSVREVLKLCDRYRREFCQQGSIQEIERLHSNVSQNGGPIEPPAQEEFKRLDDQFQQYQQEVDVASLLDEKQDDGELARLYQTALECLVRENEGGFDPQTDAQVERDFAGGKTTKPLHARLRIVSHAEHSSEQHYSLRAVQRTYHSAFKSRLKAAMTQAGIDRALTFRYLVIVRRNKLPGGEQTKRMVEEFETAGGRFHNPADEELRTLAALRRMTQEQDPHFDRWLSHRRPASDLPLCQVLQLPWCGESPNRTDDSPTNGTGSEIETEAGATTGNGADAEMIADGVVASDTASSTGTVSVAGTGTGAKSKPQTETGTEPVVAPDHLEIGQRMIGRGHHGDVVSIPLSALTKHTIILGGSGSGKSVAVRRLVEQAALAGIPSIVIDCAQDMCCFDQRWPQPPEHWRPGDDERAARFHEVSEQVVWTPGAQSSGNPLTLRPLPDFIPVKDDPEELNDAVAMAKGALEPIVAAGKSAKAKIKSGILVASLKYFAQHCAEQSLDAYIELLANLPAEAGMGVPKEAEYASEMATHLTVEKTTNALMAGSGTPMDPLVLFGDDTPERQRVRQRVRISVISLVKLKGQSESQSFLNQLAMELFSWIKRNPSPLDGRPLRGLLVIDEARDFIPSQRASVCKESVMRLAAQARKYRLGIVLATQHPKDIETKIVGNCATHLYGLNNSPASLATLEDLMAQKGGSGSDIGSLKAGQFYVHNADAGHRQPIKVQMPMSLSRSPDNPLEENQIMRLAERFR